MLAADRLAAGVLNTVLTSQLTKVVRREETGGTLGLSASLQTLAQIVSPGLGGLLLENVGMWSVGVLGALIMAWTVSFTWRKVLSQPDETDASCRPGNVSAVVRCLTWITLQPGGLGLQSSYVMLGGKYHPGIPALGGF
jgi:MFS family permease